MARVSTVISGRKIRFGLVGCGRIFEKHVEALKANSDGCEITAVCDIDPAALERGMAMTEAKGYSSLTDMLQDESIDVVVLSTPSGLHPDQGIQAAQAGKHVVSEKPMATKWEDGKRLVRATDIAGVKLFVVKQNRLNATLQQLKKALDEKRFGQIYMVNINVFWTRPQDYYDHAKWRGTWEMDGGAFMNQASHYVDLLDYLIGPIDSIQAMTATLERDIQAEDTGVVNIRWRSGALGSMNVTMLTYPKNLEGSITILGEKGTVRVGGVAINDIQVWQFADQRPEDAAIKQASYETTSVYGFGHTAYFKNVIETLRGEAKAMTDGRQGLRSLEVLTAIYRSARDRQTVSLPLDH